MIVKEFGTKNRDILIFLHGGGLSWWNYTGEIQSLEKEYHIIVPILDGHSQSDRPFASIEDNASELINFIDQNCNGSVKFIGGLSLGGQILLEMLSQRNSICGCAMIESALAYPLKTTHKLIAPSLRLSYGLIRQRWFSKLQFQSLHIRNSLFEDYYKDTCGITKSDYISILQANTNYTLKSPLSDCKAKTLVLVGSRERPIMKQSARAIQELIPNSTLETLKGYHHGELSINHADAYVDRVRELLEP
ncbi:MAG: alpha/beta hydrolase [Lachnospiraceae bacterium]|nr:alpha/beta hydrolase [Lachnospiraceae bacterium]